MGKLLLISVLLAAFPRAKVKEALPVSFSCESLTVIAKVTPEAADRYRVTLSGEGGQEPYKYIFYKESGDLVSRDFEKVDYKGLEKGAYTCTIIDKKNCKKNIEISIK